MNHTLATLLIAACACPASAQVYKCQDSSGRAVLQQTPCLGSGPRVADELKARESSQTSNAPGVAPPPYAAPRATPLPGGRVLRQIPYRPLPWTPDAMEAQAQRDLKALRSALKDPGSAQLASVRVVVFEAFDSPYTLTCGRVNAKNSYGGYTGEKSFTVLNGDAEIDKPLMLYRGNDIYGFAEPLAHCSIKGHVAALPSQ